jgi:hypothetical protein
MLKASRILLALLIQTFCPTGTLFFTLDDTIERRRGRKITAAGWFRDPVRSTDGKTVTVRGLRWLVLSLCVKPFWSDRYWSLPILSILAPAPIERKKAGTKKHLIIFARQTICLLRRWCPEREIVILADGSFAVHSLFRKATRFNITMVTRCRQDLMIHEPLKALVKRKRGRPWKHGPRLPKLSAVAASLSTLWTAIGTGARELTHQDGLWHKGVTAKPPVPVRCVLVRARGGKGAQAVATNNQCLLPEEIVSFYEMRWSIEVTFQEARAHLGVETSRGWSVKTIARTTPALFALFSLVVWLANDLAGTTMLPLQQSAWYEKTTPTFLDLLAGVRRSLWSRSIYRTSRSRPVVKQITTPLARSLLEILCRAA